MTAQIALQTFTIRKHLKDPASIERALKRVKATGLNSLELARVRFDSDTIGHIAQVCQREGIRVGSTQMKLDQIKRDLGWTARLHHQLGSPYCCVSVVSLRQLAKGERGIKHYAEELNRLGRELKQRGVALLFHHHNFEFAPIGNRTGFEILKQYLDPQLVGLVLDTYWLQRSGHDPARFIEQHAGWVKGVHLRDFQLRTPLWAPRIQDAALGEGSLDFASITHACKQSGVAYMAIEQASPDPWRSIERSVEHLHQLGLADHFLARSNP